MSSDSEKKRRVEWRKAINALLTCFVFVGQENLGVSEGKKGGEGDDIVRSCHGVVD